MASVPSAGCLLAKNQYYRTRQNSESSVSSSFSWCSDAVNVADQDKAFHGLPELIDKSWWIKSFFHNEPSPPTVGRKTLSASSSGEAGITIESHQQDVLVATEFIHGSGRLSEVLNVKGKFILHDYEAQQAIWAQKKILEDIINELSLTPVSAGV